MRRWSILMLGLGAGVFAGALLASPAAMWTGAGLVVAALLWYAASTDRPALAPAPASAVAEELSDLGSEVDRILTVAEHQAGEIVADARTRASRIRGESWVVWRQDDNGNKAEVARVNSRTAADTLATAMESRGHRQMYWVAAAD
ncbi:hypothetical protein KZZ52_08075 [Dactylosporangium sp. AC04546]|uniref:hypothetical protein n=1 Tax=Dactylosporangium sp. AC04546 TaxID=2862460 RepID=UPI001EE08360|nr:hypothetical protein [Dactylosporangium sp. AC04546]WVK85336.1 hypothetical protein KZZ52_08075 [Dactylosporangium sp. AC04546]